jgi:hypothetical protein
VRKSRFSEEQIIGLLWWLRCVDRVASWLARLWPTMFSYQFLVEVTRTEDLQHVLAGTLATGDECSMATARER